MIQPLYSVDPIEELAKEKPDVFVNCSASPTRAKKNSLNIICCHLFQKKYETPIVYVNQLEQ